MSALHQALIARDGLTTVEADAIIEEARREVAAGADPTDVLEELGLESDYVFDLLP